MNKSELSLLGRGLAAFTTWAKKNQKISQDQQKEDRICLNANQCSIKCSGSKPHVENHECGLGHVNNALLRNPTAKIDITKCKPCIQIPEIWQDKGGE